jgi:Zn ribbon nucleic-acid-binding protein
MMVTAGCSKCQKRDVMSVPSGNQLNTFPTCVATEHNSSNGPTESVAVKMQAEASLDKQVSGWNKPGLLPT